jgi:predicted glutamine amidotransferase
MCRLLGVVSADVVSHRQTLDRAPRSLAELSPDHPHGWGLAISDERRGWGVYRATGCAKEDARFHALADQARGKVLVAHIRNRTVGLASLENTHPFRSGCWVFAHNGTVDDTGPLERLTSTARRREIRGQTDSERIFAFVLTALDAAGATSGHDGGDPHTPGPAGASRTAPGAADAALRHATRTLSAQVGASNFLCSDGEVLYAFRFGRTLHVLARGGGRRGRSVVVASERVTDEPWQEVAEGTVLRVDGGAEPSWHAIS